MHLSLCHFCFLCLTLIPNNTNLSSSFSFISFPLEGHWTPVTSQSSFSFSSFFQVIPPWIFFSPHLFHSICLSLLISLLLFCFPAFVIFSYHTFETRLSALTASHFSCEFQIMFCLFAQAVMLSWPHTVVVVFAFLSACESVCTCRLWEECFAGVFRWCKTCFPALEKNWVEHRWLALFSSCCGFCLYQ